jgi:hypothetical protein
MHGVDQNEPTAKDKSYQEENDNFIFEVAQGGSGSKRVRNFSNNPVVYIL